MFKEKIQELVYKLIPERRNIPHILISLLIAFGLFLAYHLLGNHFINTMWIIDVILLSVLLFIFMFIAGLVVLKSLVVVAAELSLLIYLAQSYCGASNRSAASEEALKSLLIFSLLYIVLSFGRHLWNDLKKNYKNVENEKWSAEKIIGVSLFIVFIGLFLWQIYLVMNPIIMDLCVFK